MKKKGIDFAGKKVTVFGLGLHGGGADTVKFFAEQKARVIVTDLKSRQDLAASLEDLRKLKNVEFVLGAHRREDFTNVDLVIKTPAVPWNNKHILLAEKAGVPVLTDSALFFSLCENPIIGVTGSKGKTTVASLIGHILRRGGREVVEVGIGQTPVLGRLKLLGKKSLVVFELSSWRLSGVGRLKISPSLAVATNLLADHGDYYRSRADYEKDKRNIVAFQKKDDWKILNFDDEIISAWESVGRGKTFFYSLSSAPPAPSIYSRAGKIYFADSRRVTEVMDESDLPLSGRHNLANCLAALAAGILSGLEPTDLAEYLSDFSPLPHRAEEVAVRGGVRYINDTAATIPEAAAATLRCFGKKSVILIAGGSDKNLDFAEMAAAAAERARAVILLPGEASEKLSRALSREADTPEISSVADMAEAVASAAAAARPGETVLLSPGAASFGLFLNEFDRGEKFRAAVKELSAGEED